MECSPLSNTQEPSTISTTRQFIWLSSVHQTEYSLTTVYHFQILLAFSNMTSQIQSPTLRIKGSKEWHDLQTIFAPRQGNMIFLHYLWVKLLTLQFNGNASTTECSDSRVSFHEQALPGHKCWPCQTATSNKNKKGGRTEWASSCCKLWY